MRSNIIKIISRNVKSQPARTSYRKCPGTVVPENKERNIQKEKCNKQVNKCNTVTTHKIQPAQLSCIMSPGTVGRASKQTNKQTSKQFNLQGYLVVSVLEL